MSIAFCSFTWKSIWCRLQTKPITCSWTRPEQRPVASIGFQYRFSSELSLNRLPPSSKSTHAEGKVHPVFEVHLVSARMGNLSPPCQPCNWPIYLRDLVTTANFPSQGNLATLPSPSYVRPPLSCFFFISESSASKVSSRLTPFPCLLFLSIPSLLSLVSSH